MKQIASISISSPSSTTFGLFDFLKGHFQICRFDHWVKNIFIVPGVVVAISSYPDKFKISMLSPIFIGLIASGLVASSNYVINELLDAPFDLTHPTKKFRPTPSGRVKIGIAYIQWIVLMIAGVGLGAMLSTKLAIVLATLWIMGCFYNIPPLRTKEIPYIDVLSESINNPIRMLIGWYIISPPCITSLALLVCYWMIGCYFMAIKRFSEMRDISKNINAVSYRKSFGYYNERNLLISIMFYASASMLFLGAFIMRYRIELILSFPSIALVMAVYLNLAFQKDGAAQAPEKLYREPYLMAAVSLCAILMVSLMFIRIPCLMNFFIQNTYN